MKSSTNFSSQRGHIHLWRFVDDARRYPDWNLSADQPGCESALELLHDLLTGKTPYRTLQITEPTAATLSAPGGRGRWNSASSLRIAKLADESATPTAEYDAQSRRWSLHVNTEVIATLESMFREISLGHGDYAVDLAGKSFWIWWQVE